MLVALRNRVLGLVPGRRRPFQSSWVFSRQLRAFASVEQAGNDFQIRIVVPGFRILVHVEAGEAPQPNRVALIGRPAQPVPIERAQPFACMFPVVRRRKLLVVHPVLRQLCRRILGFGVLVEVSFPRAIPLLDNRVRATERVRKRPVANALDGVIRPIFYAEIRRAAKVAILIEVFRRPERHAFGVEGKKPPLRKRPTGSRHQLVDGDDQVALSAKRPWLDGQTTGDENAD